MRRNILNIAHRGASGRFPENTLRAFRAAADAGAVMCELDVHLTRDGAAVVIHDETVDRTTDGRGKVAAMTLAEIKRLDAGVHRGAEFAGDRIPTLDELFEAMRGRCALNIELKGEGVERQACELMRKHRALEASMLSSFEWDALARACTIEPTVRIGLLAEKEPERLIAEAVPMRAFAINPRFDMVSATLCDKAHRSGLNVYAWTVDAPEVMRMLIGYGVDGIMTNCPERLQQVLEESGGD